MPEPTTQTPGQRIEYGNFVIEVVPVALLDLLEKNARFMRTETFQRLVANIKTDGQISQLPFCVQRESGRFLVLSGNHRVKGAKSAELAEIPIIYPKAPLTHDQELAIQLSHNAIAGEDDPVILRELWSELSTVDMKMYSGLDDKSLAVLEKTQMPSLADVRLDFRTTTFMFLPEEVTEVVAAFKEAQRLVKADATILAKMAAYDKLLDGLAETNAAHNISNGATGLLAMLAVFEAHRTDLAEGWFDPDTDGAKHKGWVPLSSILGTHLVLAEVAVVIKQAVDKLEQSGDVEHATRWKALEFMAAEVLAGQ